MYISYNCNMEYLEIASRNFKTKNILYVSDLKGGDSNASYFYVNVAMKGRDGIIEAIMKYTVDQKDYKEFTDIMKKERDRLSYSLRHSNFGDGIFFDKNIILNKLYDTKPPKDE